MKCEIIKDLLPSYADNLTSDESNVEIKEHLKTCKECSDYLEEIKAPIKVKTIEKNKKDIKPFKKLNRKVLKSVIITLVICIFAAGLYSYFWEFGWKANSEDVKMTYEYKNEAIVFSFQLTNGLILSAWTKYVEREAGQRCNNIITLREAFVSKFDNRSDGFSWGIVVLDQDDKYRPLGEKDIITIVYSDKVEVIRLKEIAEELGLQ